MIIIAAEACFVASKDDVYISLWVGRIRVICAFI